MQEKKPLWEEILNFSKHKYKIGGVLIFLGVIGLALPILPGILLLAVGIMLVKPEWFEKLKSKIKY